MDSYGKIKINDGRKLPNCRFYPFDMEDNIVGTRAYTNQFSVLENI